MTHPEYLAWLARNGVTDYQLADVIGQLAGMAPAFRTVEAWRIGRRQLGRTEAALLALMERVPGAWHHLVREVHPRSKVSRVRDEEGVDRVTPLA